MRVLVVGSEGYLGRALCRELLERKHMVLRADAGMHGPVEEGVVVGSELEMIASNFMGPAPDAVIWLGAVAHDPAGVIDWHTMSRWVAEKPARGAYWCAARRIPFIAVSSLSVFSDVGHYPAAKRLLEHYLMNLPRWERIVSILRFGTLYGAVEGAHPAGYRPHLLLNSMVLDAVRGRPVCVSAPAVRSPVLHVSDAAVAIAHTVEQTRPRGTALNLYSTCGTLLEFAEMVRRVLPRAQLELGTGPHDNRDYGWGEFAELDTPERLEELAWWTNDHLAEIEAIEKTFPGNMYHFLGVWE